MLLHLIAQSPAIMYIKAQTNNNNEIISLFP